MLSLVLLRRRVYIDLGLSSMWSCNNSKTAKGDQVACPARLAANTLITGPSTSSIPRSRIPG